MSKEQNFMGDKAGPSELTGETGECLPDKMLPREDEGVREMACPECKGSMEVAAVDMRCTKCGFIQDGCPPPEAENTPKGLKNLGDNKLVYSELREKLVNRFTGSAKPDGCGCMIFYDTDVHSPKLLKFYQELISEGNIEVKESVGKVRKRVDAYQTAELVKEAD